MSILGPQAEQADVVAGSTVAFAGAENGGLLVRTGMRRPRAGRPRRSTIAAAAVVLVFVLCVSGLAVGLFIQTELRPIDGRFGLPQQLDFPFCGRSYQLGNGSHMTKSQMDAEMTPGYQAYILEPSVGQIPLVDVFTKCPRVPMVGGHGSVAQTVGFLQVGPDDYAVYVLEGGP